MRLLIATLATAMCMSGTCFGEIADSYLPRWLKQRAATIEAQITNRPFDQIGWASDLATAMKLGAEHDRPIFVFTHDGKINTGRC